MVLSYWERCLVSWCSLFLLCVLSFYLKDKYNTILKGMCHFGLFGSICQEPSSKSRNRVGTPLSSSWGPESSAISLLPHSSHSWIMATTALGSLLKASYPKRKETVASLNPGRKPQGRALIGWLFQALAWTNHWGQMWGAVLGPVWVLGEDATQWWVVPPAPRVGVGEGTFPQSGRHCLSKLNNKGSHKGYSGPKRKGLWNNTRPWSLWASPASHILL